MSTNSSADENARDSLETQAPPPGKELVDLRELLLGEEQEQIARLQQRLDNPRLHAEDMSRALPQAITLSAEHGDHLGRALQPTVEQAVRASVKKDSRVLVDALFPLMGPAIRKSIASALRGMVESLDKVLRQSLSIQGLRWRLEALRAGKTFAEVALAHSLVYRVEQVFLIHKKTGLLLQHVVADHASVQDGDMVSGMLTAIQDFVKDSFNVQEGSELENLQVGPLSVWIEQGPQAVLAAVVRGNPPQEFRPVLQEAMEQIHAQESAALESFEGDSSPFEVVRDLLESCLQARYQAKKTKSSPAFWVAAAILALALAAGLFFRVRENIRWGNYLDRLRAEDGLAVTSAMNLEGKHHVMGLRDPMARDPEKILGETELNPRNVVGHWEPYQSLRPRFLLARARNLLQPPETASVQITGDMLVVTGVAPTEWIRESAKLARTLPGISGVDCSGVQEMGKRLKDGIREVESRIIRFAFRTSEFAPGAFADMDKDLEEIRTLNRYAHVMGRRLDILVIGHADSSGLESTNSRLSLERAVEVQKKLDGADLKGCVVRVEGVGTRQPVRAERTEEDRSLNRSVSIQITLNDATS